MLTSEDLLKAVDTYRDGRVSLDHFEEWFRTNSRGMFGEDPQILEACLTIDAAFSELRYGAMTKQEFGQELAVAVLPFVQPTSTAENLARRAFEVKQGSFETSVAANFLSFAVQVV